jgi:hypothetical protein
MIPLTPEQREYKERTLNQLLDNQSLLETRLNQETRPDVVKSIEQQLADIEAHVNRLQDELAGDVVFDEPVADELFKQAARSLANKKFHLAKKHIHRLETIEPFYPGIDRLKQEAESGRVSRRTRSIAQGTAVAYPGTAPPPTLRPANRTIEKPAVAAPVANGAEVGKSRWTDHLFQFHIILSCLVILLLICVMLGIGGVSVLQWLIEGG